MKAYFGKLYLDKEKDLIVLLYMEQDSLTYIIKAENHQLDNLTMHCKMCDV